MTTHSCAQRWRPLRGSFNLIASAILLLFVGTASELLLFQSTFDSPQPPRFARAPGHTPFADRINSLMDALDDPDFQTQADAAETLGEKGRAATVAAPALAACYQPPYRRIEPMAAHALVGIGRSAVPALNVALLQHPDSFRFDYTDTLAAIGAPAMPALIRDLHAANAGVRQAAAYALGDACAHLNSVHPENASVSRTAMDALLHALTDSNPDVRTAAVTALDTIGKPAAPALRRALQNAKS